VLRHRCRQRNDTEGGIFVLRPSNAPGGSRALPRVLGPLPKRLFSACISSYSSDRDCLQKLSCAYSLFRVFAKHANHAGELVTGHSDLAAKSLLSKSMHKNYRQAQGFLMRPTSYTIRASEDGSTNGSQDATSAIGGLSLSTTRVASI
jgi:hypothetical protein